MRTASPHGKGAYRVRRTASVKNCFPPLRQCDSQARCACQSRRCLETGSLRPPQAALRRFPRIRSRGCEVRGSHRMVCRSLSLPHPYCAAVPATKDGGKTRSYLPSPVSRPGALGARGKPLRLPKLPSPVSRSGAVAARGGGADLTLPRPAHLSPAGTFPHGIRCGSKRGAIPCSLAPPSSP